MALARPLYVDFVVDSRPSASAEDLGGIVGALEWRRSDTISAAELQAMVDEWETGAGDGAGAIVLDAAGAAEAVRGRVSEALLDLAEREWDRRLRAEHGVSSGWVDAAQELFSVLDVRSQRVIGLDEVLFLFAAVVGTDAAALAPEDALQHTKHLMRELGESPFVTARRLKRYFARNRVGEAALASTLGALKRHIARCSPALQTRGLPDLLALARQRSQDALPEGAEGAQIARFLDTREALLREDARFDNPRVFDAALYMYTSFCEEHRPAARGAKAPAADRTFHYFRALVTQYRTLVGEVLACLPGAPAGAAAGDADTEHDIDRAVLNAEWIDIHTADLVQGNVPRLPPDSRSGGVGSSDPDLLPAVARDVARKLVAMEQPAVANDLLSQVPASLDGDGPAAAGTGPTPESELEEMLRQQGVETPVVTVGDITPAYLQGMLRSMKRGGQQTPVKAAAPPPDLLAASRSPAPPTHTPSAAGLLVGSSPPRAPLAEPVPAASPSDDGHGGGYHPRDRVEEQEPEVVEVAEDSFALEPAVVSPKAHGRIPHRKAKPGRKPEWRSGGSKAEIPSAIRPLPGRKAQMQATARVKRA